MPSDDLDADTQVAVWTSAAVTTADMATPARTMTARATHRPTGLTVYVYGRPDQRDLIIASARNLLRAKLEHQRTGALPPFPQHPPPARRRLSGMTEQTANTLPSRIVDAQHRGWYRTGDGPDAYRRSGSPDCLTLAELRAQHGPLREVVPPSQDSTDQIYLGIRIAGNKAVASLLAALGNVSRSYSARPDAPQSGSLLAGREGSWEAASMNSLAWGVGLDLAGRPGRIDARAVGIFENVLRQWTTGRTYTEVAENLACLFSDAADKMGGWGEIADRYFRPGGLSHDLGVIETVHGWLMSRTHDGYEPLV